MHLEELAGVEAHGCEISGDFEADYAVQAAPDEDYAHYRRGEAATVSPAIADITGTAPRSIEQFALDYAPAFAG
jgi:hypothetical protein